MKIVRCFEILTAAFLALLSFSGFSQFKINGFVLNEKDKSPIPFVAIGMMNTSVGTISESDGSFEIEIPEALKNKALIFSALGFERQSFSVENMTPNAVLTVRLKEKVVVLNEITVKSKTNFRHFEFGNREFNGGSIYAHTESAGSAMVMLVDNKSPYYSAFKFPAYLGRVSLRIVNNTFKEFKLRLRLYAVDSITGKPGKDLLNKDILVYNKIRNGLIELKLSDHNIIVDHPFFVGFEWIMDAKDRAFLHKQYVDWYRKHPELVTGETARVGANAVEYTNFQGAFWAGTSFGTWSDPEQASKIKCYFRYNSFGEWYVSPAAMCMRIIMLK